MEASEILFNKVGEGREEERGGREMGGIEMGGRREVRRLGAVENGKGVREEGEVKIYINLGCSITAQEVWERPPRIPQPSNRQVEEYHKHAWQ